MPRTHANPCTRCHLSQNTTIVRVRRAARGAGRDRKPRLRDDADVVDVHALAVDRVQVPERALAQGDRADPQVLHEHGLDQPRPLDGHLPHRVPEELARAVLQAHQPLL